MKLTFKTVIVAAMALAVAAACSKETNAPGKEEGKEPEVVPAETVVLKFTANSEAVKTTLDGNTPTWEDGDEVKVTYVSKGETKTAKTVAAVSEGVATFTVEVASDVTDLYFSYPYDVNATLLQTAASPLPFPQSRTETLQRPTSLLQRHPKTTTYSISSTQFPLPRFRFWIQR